MAWCNGAQRCAGPVAYSRGRGSDSPRLAGGVLRRAVLWWG